VQDTLGETVAHVDAVAILTEWEEFKQFQPIEPRQLIFDGRNHLKQKNISPQYTGL